MAPKNENNYIRVTTPPFRLSFPWLATPQPPIDGKGEPKFGIKMMFPKATAEKDLAEIRKVCAHVANSFWGGKIPGNLKKPLHDGDTESEYPEDKGFLYASARCKNKPGIVDGAMREIKTEEEIKDRLYPGCWCRATIQIGAGDKGGSKFVHLALCNIQLLRGDTKFGNRKDAKDDFAAVEGYVDESVENSEVAADFESVAF
jgi:hypothetical protein